MCIVHTYLHHPQWHNIGELGIQRAGEKIMGQSQGKNIIIIYKIRQCTTAIKSKSIIRKE